MTVPKLNRRIDWLEKKMVQVLWLLISATSALVRFVTSVVLVDEQYTWLRITVFVVTWLVLGWFLQRHTFRGAPDHIRFIDP
jgi:hydrogenase-4 membrane subunit HyfE